MLRKLLKYDFRAYMKYYRYLWPAVLLLSLAGHWSVSTRSSLLAIIFLPAIIAAAVVIVACFVLPQVLAGIRFYSGTFGRKGYLMNTLPATSLQLLLSKIISSVLCFLVSSLFALFALILLLGGFWNGLGFTGSMLIEGFLSYDLGMLLLSLFLYLIAGVFFEILYVQFSFCLGHLFQRKRIMWSVLFCVTITVICQVLTQFFPLSLEGSELSGASSAFFWWALGLGLASVLFFLVNNHILKKKLNLE